MRLDALLRFSYNWTKGNIMEKPEDDEAVKTELSETLRKVQESAPREDDGYDRAQVRKLAEEFSRRYVKLVRTEP